MARFVLHVQRAVRLNFDIPVVAAHAGDFEAFKRVLLRTYERVAADECLDGGYGNYVHAQRGRVLRPRSGGRDADPVAGAVSVSANVNLHIADTIYVHEQCAEQSQEWSYRRVHVLF